MSVLAVIRRHRQGQTAEQVQVDVPDIPLSHIYAALAYYFANLQRMDDEIAAEDAESARQYQEWNARAGSSSTMATRSSIVHARSTSGEWARRNP